MLTEINNIKYYQGLKEDLAKAVIEICDWTPFSLYLLLYFHVYSYES